jgi:hypothetical protein
MRVFDFPARFMNLPDFLGVLGGLGGSISCFELKEQSCLTN